MEIGEDGFLLPRREAEPPALNQNGWVRKCGRPSLLHLTKKVESGSEGGGAYAIDQNALDLEMKKAKPPALEPKRDGSGSEEGGA